MKTNLLKSIFISLILVMGVTQINAATVTSDGTARLYFNMSAISWWVASNGDGNFGYFFNNSTGKNAWSAHSVKHDGNTYYVVIPKGTWAGVILTRNNTSTSPSWDNKWNQTGDITLSSTSNYISKFSEGSTSVTWGTAVKPTSNAAVSAAASTIFVGTSTTLTPSLTSNANINDIKSTTYTISPTTGASISGNTFTASAEGTYTITATVTYHPDGYSDTKLQSTATATTTIVAEVPAEETHDVTVSYICGETKLQDPTTVNTVGVETSVKVTAPEIAKYTFANWTLGADVATTDDLTSNAINITTKAGGSDFTLVANYKKAKLTYTVTVPAGTENCYLVGAMNGWDVENPIEMTKQGENVFTTTLEGVATTDEYKYISQKGTWDYADVQETNRTWTANDVVTAWKDPLATNVYLVGNMFANWDKTPDKEFRKTTTDATTASIVVALDANKDYELKVRRGDDWTSCTSKITNTVTGLQFSSSNNDNCKMKTTVAGEYTFTWTISSSKLDVTYPTLYAVTATANDAAMGTIAGAGEYGKGSTATLTATPNDGYLFVNWTKGGEVVATTQEYSFTVTAAVELVANFEAAPEEVHNVTVSYVCGGNKIADNQTVAAVGETTAKTVEAPAIFGYTFASWTLGAGITSADATANPISINIVAGASDYTLTANYTEIPKVKVYVVNNKKWSKINVYGWKEGEAQGTPAWPGQEITANLETEKVAGFDVYSYSVVPDSYDNLILNNGSDKTEDYKWTDGKYYHVGAAKNYAGGTKDEVTTILEDEVLATNVYLAGDMTNWGEGQLQFRKKAAGDAVATVSVELTEGEHKFKIIEDGKWLGNNGTMTREYHENWIFRAKQDDGTNDEVDATIYADENGIYTFTWNSTDNKLTVTYPAPTAKYIYFKNNPGWNKVYVYFFQEDNFNDKGAVSTGLTVAKKRVGEMTQVGSSDIWQYEYGTAGLPLSGVIAFTETLQENKSNFSNTKAAYRTDFNKNMELFIPQKTSNETKNNTKYYSTGLWMKYNSTESGYVFANNIDDEWKEDRLVADAPGGYHFATQVSLGGNTTYNFKVKNIKGDWFGKKSTTMTSTNTNVELEVGAGDEYNVKLTTTSAGNYTFSIDLSDGKMMVSVEYPLQANDYRLVYVESEVLGQAPYTKFHPAQSIRGIAEGTKKDIVSFYINKANNPAILLQQCTNINGANITWTDVAIQSINGNQGANPGRAKAPAKRSVELYIGEGCPAVTENGVYNFVLEQTNGNATILNEETHPYTGDYYIRTNAADGGWRKYNTNPDNIMTHSQTALKHGGYDYYFCKWALENTNVHYVVANKYSYCVSDTLKNGDFTNNEGKIPHNANVRYTWNSSTNAMSRAYINGSGDVKDRYLILEGDANIKDIEGNTFKITGLNANEANFKDMGNWLYQLEVKANSNAKVKLTANYNDTKQYFKGGAGAEEKVSLITGATKDYKLRLVYDFKTNYLISALIDDTEIGEDLELDEVMIIRSHHDDANTIQVAKSKGSVTAIQTIYGVMTFNKTTLNDNTKSQYERALYWVSFPFDVDLGEAFGFGNYGEHWIMEYYDGEARAKNGAWVDSDTYWKYIKNPNYTLEAGKGYVLCLDLDLLGNNAEFWDNENTEIALYFPSSEENPIVINNEATQRTTTVLDHICSIERDDRNIHDSNWNIIGVPAYTKIAGMTGGGVISYYRYDASKNEYDPAMTSGFNFNTMHAYMVQYAGTINWTEQATSIAALAARKSPTSKDQYTLRLAIQQEGEQQDHTFIRLQEDNATAEFDMNYDLCKIINRGANIYSMINDVEVAANVLPVEERVIPIGLDIHETGNYTFAMPDGTDGITAILIDYETGKETNLLLADYNTELREGTNNERFALRVRPNHVATAVETIIDGANGQIQKYIINGALYILNNGQLYDAQGRMVQP